MTLRGRALKIATGDMVAALGGFEAAASRMPIGKSQLHRCASVNDDGCFLNLRDAVELERFAPRPLVTMEMARQAGGVFLPLPECFGDDDTLPMQVIALSRELGDVSRSVSDALADETATGREAERIERELDQLIECAVQARAHVRRLQGKDETSSSPPRR